MDWNKKIATWTLLLLLPLLLSSCRISMGLAPISSIDYSKVKTVSIATFQNQA